MYMSPYCIVLGVALLVCPGHSETVGLQVTNTWLSGSVRYVQAKCVFTCNRKIARQTLAASIQLSVSYTNFESWGNLIVESGTQYNVQNVHNMWANNGQCTISFQVQTNKDSSASGQCSRNTGSSDSTTTPSTTTETTTTPSTTTGTTKTLSTTTGTTTTASTASSTTTPITTTQTTGSTSNNLVLQTPPYNSGSGFRGHWRCDILCTSQFAHGTLKATVKFDRGTSNFNAYGNMQIVASFIDSVSTWKVVNTQYIAKNNTLCSFSFALDYPSPREPIPSGTCAESDGSTSQTTLSTGTTSTQSTTTSQSTTTTSQSTSTTSQSTSTTSQSTSTTSQSTSTTTSSQSTTTSAGTVNYPYSELLEKSILFYAAQRSGDLPDPGPLPTGNPISWRYDSTLLDGQDKGRDLTGGFFDAGDNVKFNFPMAFTTTILSWGLNLFRDAYDQAGQLDNMYDCIKWPLDYFLKCWDNDAQVFFGQVGNGHSDHSVWNRPENISSNRPTYDLTTAKPGSDLAAETAAALAAGYIAFKDRDSTYADKLLTAARQLYQFAYQYRGLYHEAIPDAANFYRSWSSYNDELFWAAAMLHRATGESTYLTFARKFESLNTPWAFSWDDKNIGAQLLMYENTSEDKYRNAVINFVTNYRTGSGGVTITPKGLSWISEWGSLRYAGNAAFIAVAAAKLGIDTSANVAFAEKQINYALGDTGRSFVVGYGINPPTRPHHRASSCPDITITCDASYLSKGEDNPHVLNGALVGGPDMFDNYVDNRQDYRMNEVATDYNAGFQSAVAGLKHFLG